MRVLCAPWCQAPQKKKAKVKGGGGEDGEADGGSGLDSDEEDVGATGQLFVRNLPCVWCGCGCGLDAGQLPMACRRLCFSGASCYVCVCRVLWIVLFLVRCCAGTLHLRRSCAQCSPNSELSAVFTWQWTRRKSRRVSRTYPSPPPSSPPPTPTPSVPLSAGPRCMLVSLPLCPSSHRCRDCTLCSPNTTATWTT